jgi:hypothetical protein
MAAGILLIKCPRYSPTPKLVENKLRRWKSRIGADHEVKLHIQMGSASELAAVGVDTSYTPTATLYVTYVFLDTDERRRFAQTSHEYLNDWVKKRPPRENGNLEDKARCRTIVAHVHNVHMRHTNPQPLVRVF